MTHRTATELAAHLDHIRAAPSTVGSLELVVRRPAEGLREVLEAAELDTELGLSGDRWVLGSANPSAMLTVMNHRVAAFVAVDPDRVPLAGDQLYVDLDLSHENLPEGSRLQVGEAEIEISEKPHLGCGKFMGRFGEAAMRFVNGRTGRSLRLRGLNARVVTPGTVRRGDKVAKP